MSEKLEKAAKEYSDTIQAAISRKLAIVEDFKAGAKWQYAQDHSTILDFQSRYNEALDLIKKRTTASFSIDEAQDFLEKYDK